MRLRDV